MNRILVFWMGYTALVGCSHELTPANQWAVVEDHSFASVPSQKPETRWYSVVSGDTLYSIAWAAGIDVAKLVKINALDTTQAIVPGQRLLLSGNFESKKFKKSKENVKKDLALKPRSRLSSSLAVKNTSSVEAGGVKKLVWQWPTKGSIKTHFGQGHPSSKGIQLSGRKGAPVLAAAAGEVVYAGAALRGYGKLIIIKHNDDFLSAYAHNDEIYVINKQKIKKGQQIADMGNSGTQEVQLHFEVRYQGKPVDPLKFLPSQSM